MRFSSSASANEKNVLALLKILAAKEIDEQRLVDRRPGGEVERIERLVRGEPCGLESSFRCTPFSLDEFELRELEQVAQVIDVLLRAALRDGFAFIVHRRQLELLEVMLDQYHAFRLGLHDHEFLSFLGLGSNSKGRHSAEGPSSVSSD